ncbi:hypothetical protein SAMN05660706_14221 [Desulfoscipio geothermicus DSM 3669]|uniref:Uncharacterized protein n=1 Tax=Desulfoscipio geothermicus DSM 3669 TaxID=1121426 RepID=A0A1I6EHA1_9FIRM|nr:hypothetical protein SAMN05660706_14221 [Desulfoscipio geothermicus DSM 3669]
MLYVGSAPYTQPPVCLQCLPGAGLFWGNVNGTEKGGAGWLPPGSWGRVKYTTLTVGGICGLKSFHYF